MIFFTWVDVAMMVTPSKDFAEFAFRRDRQSSFFTCCYRALRLVVEVECDLLALLLGAMIWPPLGISGKEKTPMRDVALPRALTWAPRSWRNSSYSSWRKSS